MLQKGEHLKSPISKSRIPHVENPPHFLAKSPIFSMMGILIKMEENCSKNYLLKMGVQFKSVENVRKIRWISNRGYCKKCGRISTWGIDAFRMGDFQCSPRETGNSDLRFKRYTPNCSLSNIFHWILQSILG